MRTELNQLTLKLMQGQIEYLGHLQFINRPMDEIDHGPPTISRELKKILDELIFLRTAPYQEAVSEMCKTVNLVISLGFQNDQDYKQIMENSQIRGVIPKMIFHTALRLYTAPWTATKRYNAILQLANSLTTYYLILGYDSPNDMLRPS